MQIFQVLLVAIWLVCIQARAISNTTLPANVTIFAVGTLSDNKTIYSNVSPSSDSACYELDDVDENKKKWNKKFKVTGHDIYLKLQAVGKKRRRGIHGLREAARRFGRGLHRFLHNHHDADDFDSIYDLYYEMNQPVQEEIDLDTSPRSILVTTTIDVGEEVVMAANRARAAYYPGGESPDHMEYSMHHGNGNNFGHFETTIFRGGSGTLEDSDVETLVGSDGSVTILCK